MDLAILKEQGFARLRMPQQIQIGSTVTVRLYDGRVVVAKVTAVVDSVLGRKIHISFGAFAFKVDETQVIRVVPLGRCQSLAESQPQGFSMTFSTWPTFFWIFPAIFSPWPSASKSGLFVARPT